MPTVEHDVTLVVPTLGRVHAAVEIAACVDQLDARPSEILFVFQDESELATFERATASLKIVRPLLADRRSATVARNLGLTEASTRYTAFLDDDCMPAHRNWLANLTAPLLDPVVTLTTGPYLGWTGSSSRAFRQLALRLAPPFLEPFGRADSGRSQWCDTVLGGNFIGRTDQLIDAGGFDEGFDSPSLYEETELSIRLSKRTGGRVWFASDAAVHHNQGASGGMRDQGDVVSERFLLDQRSKLLRAVYGTGTSGMARIWAYRAARSARSMVKTPRTMRR